MASFTETFPESGIQEPTLPGQTPIARTPLTTLRRRQLVDLADAYEIPIDRDATKPRILPALINAQQAGVLDKEPINRVAFRKAQRNSDQEPLPLLQEEIEGQPTPGEVAAAERSERAAKNPLIALRKLCKSRGVKVAGGATIDDMIEALGNESSGSNTNGEDDDPGQAGGIVEVETSPDSRPSG